MTNKFTKNVLHSCQPERGLTENLAATNRTSEFRNDRRHPSGAMNQCSSFAISRAREEGLQDDGKEKAGGRGTRSLEANRKAKGYRRLNVR